MSPTSSDQQSVLQTLVDRAEIEDVLVRYCRAIDRGDLPMLRGVFHDDAVIVHPPLNLPVAEFCPKIIDLVRMLGSTLHQLTNVGIEIEDGIAYSEAYFSAWHDVAAAAGDGAVFPERPDSKADYAFVGGRYINWLEKRDGTWRISDHTTICEWETWLASDHRSGLVAIGRERSFRDSRDPVYRRAAEKRKA
ncbi:MAG: nuclear transport factor 2 family protein [Dehalococcoidia bacterium]